MGPRPGDTEGHTATLCVFFGLKQSMQSIGPDEAHRPQVQVDCYVRLSDRRMQVVPAPRHGQDVHLASDGDEDRPISLDRSNGKLFSHNVPPIFDRHHQ